MGLILDTNALSVIAEGEPGAAKSFARASHVAIPVIVLGEYKFGIAQSRHKCEYERWLEEMVSVTRILDINDETARWYAVLREQLKEARHADSQQRRLDGRPVPPARPSYREPGPAF